MHRPSGGGGPITIAKKNKSTIVESAAPLKTSWLVQRSRMTRSPRRMRSPCSPPKTLLLAPTRLGGGERRGSVRLPVVLRPLLVSFTSTLERSWRWKLRSGRKREEWSAMGHTVQEATEILRISNAERQAGRFCALATGRGRPAPEPASCGPAVPPRVAICAAAHQALTGTGRGCPEAVRLLGLNARTPGRPKMPTSPTLY